MRIRRNTEQSSTTECYGGDTSEETYMCHLNQSPWDVTSSYGLTNIVDSSCLFPSPSSSSPLMFGQFDGEDDEFNGNVSLGDSNGVVSQSLVSVERLNLIAASDINDRSPEFEDVMDLCDYDDHKYKAVEVNSPVNTSDDDDDQMTVKMSVPPKRGRPRGTTKKPPASAAASNNPYEFYYYSGFGPRWGRKRGGSGDEKVVTYDQKSSSSDDDDDDDEEEVDYKTAAYGGGDNSYDYDEEESDDEKMNRREKLKTMMMMKKKKIKSCRKPVKERSLQSLM